MVFNVDVEKDYLLGDNPREVAVYDTEKPVAYIRVVVTSKQGMWDRSEASQRKNVSERFGF